MASFGGEVALILRELEAQPGMVTNPKAAVGTRAMVVDGGAFTWEYHGEYHQRNIYISNIYRY